MPMPQGLYGTRRLVSGFNELIAIFLCANLWQFFKKMVLVLIIRRDSLFLSISQGFDINWLTFWHSLFLDEKTENLVAFGLI